MKLIMENWRHYVNEIEKEKIEEISRKEKMRRIAAGEDEEQEGDSRFRDAAKGVAAKAAGAAGKAAGAVGKKVAKVRGALPTTSGEKMKKAMEELPGVAQPGVETVGDLKKFLKLAKAKELGGEIGKEAVGLLADMIPGGTTALDAITKAKDVAGVVMNLAKAEDDYNTGTKLDVLNVDDKVSKIVDNPIETNFISYLIKDVLAKAPNDEPLENYDATELLQQYIAKKFGGVTVKK